MYRTCLRCDGSLGGNTEILHLPVGRKIAFDTRRGRLWVICTRCGQWNLTPLEERWEALEECERLATSAEVRASGTSAALAQTETGLELLRVGGMSDADIANWRYGRRIAQRNRSRLLWLMPLEGVALSMGISMFLATRSALASAYATGVLALLLYFLWRRPPRLWDRFDDARGRRRTLWFWQRQMLRLDCSQARQTGPVLIVPRVFGELHLRGDDAVAALASLLPKLNHAECVSADVARAVRWVTSAEGSVRERMPVRLGGVPQGKRRRKRETHATYIPRRTWQQVVGGAPSLRLARADPEHRLALEMAVTEELEQRELGERTEQLAEEWKDEEEIGAISDDLLLPDGVRRRFAKLRKTSDVARLVRDEGWVVTRAVIAADVLNLLTRELTPLLFDGAARGGIRHLLDVPCIRELARSKPVREVAESVLGTDCFAVRGILFDKSPDANWKVIWHQDLTIAVRERRNVPGFGGWTEKDGVPHVQPPVEVLERMLAVRVHLDHCGPRNGPVRVIPGSHREGRLSPAAIDAWKEKGREVDCVVERGGILAFRPLILHASSAAARPAHRRVVHLEFASGGLPGGLAWYHRV